MVVFFVFLAAGDFLGLGQWEHPFRCAVLGAAIWFFSRHVIDWKPRNWLGSILIGLVVIAIWVAPDALWPGYRMHWLFNNQFFKPSSSLPAGYTESTMVLIFRTIRAVVLVPIIEELFWRGWLIRWLINPDFEKVALGAYQFGAFVIASLLFASEHGSYWEVGLICGLIYNWWMVRTKSLADLTLTHAVSNAALSAYVIIGGHWEYWL
jgi:CAAX prenyl protease-like protein